MNNNFKTKIINCQSKIVNRKLSIILLLAAMTASCGNKSKTSNAPAGETSAIAKTEQQSPADKKIPMERGSYVEEINMMGMDLKKTVYFDHWGDWTASEDKSEVTIMGHTDQTNKLEITKGNKHWNLDLDKKKGTSFESNAPASGMAAALKAVAGGDLPEGVEIKELGEENYLGYTCKKTQVKYSKSNMDMTVLSYGNLTMKMEGTMGKSNMSTKITSIDLSAPPASIFEVPADIEIQELKIKN